MKGTISIIGMQFFAYHGVYKQEQKIGSNFEVDVIVTQDVTNAVCNDNLDGTFNYEIAFDICKETMQQPQKLIERVAFLIMENIKKKVNNIFEIKVVVRKIHPPLGAEIKYTSIEIIG